MKMIDRNKDLGFHDLLIDYHASLSENQKFFVLKERQALRPISMQFFLSFLAGWFSSNLQILHFSKTS